MFTIIINLFIPIIATLNWRTFVQSILHSFGIKVVNLGKSSANSFNDFNVEW